MPTKAMAKTPHPYVTNQRGGFEPHSLGIPTPLKNMKLSWDNDSQYTEKQSCSKPPTSIGT